MDVSIIIVNYNTKDLLFNCLKSIYKHTYDVEFEIIVVDNASVDGSQDCVKCSFPQVLLVESKVNLGFGKANNLGAKYSKGNFLFLLNSDTVLIENSVKILFSFFVENGDKLNIGVLGTILVDEKLDNNGFGNSFPTCSEENKKNLRTIPIINFFVSAPIEKKYDFEKKYFEIDYVIGADMFLRKNLFDKMKGFSKEFFMYYEETDLQKRMHNIGFKQYILTKTKIIHLEEGSGKVINNYSNRKRIITHKSRIIYLKRNDEQNYFKYALFFLFILFLNFFNFKYSLKENVSYFKEIVKILLK